MTVVGIDVGGSTTKIIAIRDGKILNPIQVKANDAKTSVYGAFGRYCSENAILLKDIEEVKVTGVGSTFITEDLYGIPTKHINEFQAIGLGGLHMSGLKEAVIVSMGTGTAFVHANEHEIVHLGGTGVGGGTLRGLASEMLDLHGYESIVELAKNGNLSHVDLTIGDLATHSSGSMPDNTTASNFGKISDMATKEDMALGLVNMIFQTVGVMSAFLVRCYPNNDIVLCGNLSNIPFARELFSQVEKLHNVKFHIPDGAGFITALGTALAKD